MKIYDAERYTLIVEVEIPFIATCTVNSSKVSSYAGASSKSLPVVVVSIRVGGLGYGHTPLNGVHNPGNINPKS